MSKITDYELGNYALHRIGSECHALANDCKQSHPEHSKFFGKLGRAINTYGQDMEYSTDREFSKMMNCKPIDILEFLKKEIKGNCNVQHTSKETT